MPWCGDPSPCRAGAEHDQPVGRLWLSPCSHEPSRTWAATGSSAGTIPRGNLHPRHTPYSLWTQGEIGDIANKVYLVKAVVFPVVTNGCERWTIKESWEPKN